MDNCQKVLLDNMLHDAREGRFPDTVVEQDSEGHKRLAWRIQKGAKVYIWVTVTKAGSFRGLLGGPNNRPELQDQHATVIIEASDGWRYSIGFNGILEEKTHQRPKTSYLQARYAHGRSPPALLSTLTLPTQKQTTRPVIRKWKSSPHARQREAPLVSSPHFTDRLKTKFLAKAKVPQALQAFSDLIDRSPMQSYPGRILSPDWTTLDKLASQLKKPQSMQIRLMAAGELSQESVDALRHIIEEADQNKQIKQSCIKFDKCVWEITNPNMHFCLLSRNSTENCSSFAQRLFPNVVLCQNRFGLFSPNSCRPRNLNVMRALCEKAEAQR